MKREQMSASALSELRLLSSAELDSRSILTTVLAGDHRLAIRLEEAQLLPIASRIRARLRTGPGPFFRGARPCSQMGLFEPGTASQKHGLPSRTTRSPSSTN